MIENSNALLKTLWLWQAKRKLKSDDIPTQYTSIYIIGAFGKFQHVELIIRYLHDSSQVLRNRAAQSLKEIYPRLENPEDKNSFVVLILKALENSDSLTHKLTLIEVMRDFDLKIREKILGPMILQTENDLQYIVIQSLGDTKDFDILDAVLNSADTTDLILRKTALKTWYEGIKLHDLELSVAYCAPRMHYVIRAAYELQTKGEFLRNLLSHANNNDLPSPKAYPDFIMRYFTELLGNWEYDPDAYRSLHAILVPSYFTFNTDESVDEDRPFMIL
ncbi:MAG: hypothetical protein HeimC2_27420 [Candidatus Heimdallarchaeota archaeon LC_2]|nr:MAG: hypothetical protein HeimC2_27420 [Candidatus Heimdallarchaeota archaeon LC_2]